VETPDLFSFYQQLAAANAEARKANRRAAEAFSQWGETLARFESGLEPLRETIGELSARTASKELPRSYCLLLVEFLDRMHRLARAFSSPPASRSWLPARDAAWRQAWETQRQGFVILIGHLEDLLKKEGVVRIEVLDRPFDPVLMVAVATEPDPRHSAQRVLEEISAGYYHHDELLRPAQVKVSVSP
jgi:molecular chaperone GrpE (heat shock protein)